MPRPLVTPSSRLIRGLCCLPLFAALIWVAGCGGGGKSNKDNISGKVTMGGQPVAGDVEFIGSDGNKSGSPIAPDGKYQVFGVAKGTAKIVVKAGLATSGGGGAKTKVDMGPNAPAAASGVAPPAKYASPDNGLTFEVKGGEQTHNIELNP